MSLLVAFASTCLILAAACSIVQANVLFHFSLDFHVKQPENSLINKTIIVENNSMSLAENEESTSAPSQLEAMESEYCVVAVQMLEKTRLSVQQLNSELAPLVGRSNDLAARLKHSLRYVNEVDESLENRNDFTHHLEILREYVRLVNTFKEPSPLGVRTLEYVLLKLTLEKYDLLAKQHEVNEFLQRVEAVWTSYKNTQVVLLENST